MIVIVGLTIGTVVFQRVHYHQNRPRIIEEATDADAKGEAMFEALGVPPGAEPRRPGEKQMIRKSPHAPTQRIIWKREYNVPGAFETAQEWYQKRLLADGWTEFTRSPGSGLVRQYRKDKWLVTLSRMAFLEHPQGTRIELQLEWNYRTRPR